MKLTKKYIRRDGVKYMSIYRGDEMLVVLPYDDTSADVFRIYQDIEDEREAAEAEESNGKSTEAFTVEFQRWFRFEWGKITAELSSRYPEKIKNIRFVSKR